MKIDLQSAIVALTGALDFVGVDEVHHGKRVALIAAAIADELGWDAPAIHDLLYAGMLHDCGVSRQREHRQLTETLEWEGAQEHCLRGEELLRDFAPLAHLAPVIRYHHSRWTWLEQQALAPDVVRFANLFFLADRTDVLFVPYLSGQALHDRLLWEFPQFVGRLGALAGTLLPFASLRYHAPGSVAPGVFGQPLMQELIHLSEGSFVPSSLGISRALTPDSFGNPIGNANRMRARIGDVPKTDRCQNSG